MAGATEIITALLGTAGAVAPGVAQIINAREAERRAKRAAAKAVVTTNDQANPPQVQSFPMATVPQPAPWPLWAKIAVGVAGTAATVAVGAMIYKAVAGNGNGSRRTRRR